MSVVEQTRAAAPSPFRPPPPPPGTVRPAPETPADVLDELTAVVTGAAGAVLASVDGFAIASSSNMEDDAAHAAMLAAATGLARQLMTIGGGNELRQLVVDHDEGLLLLWPIGEYLVLAMVAERTVDQSRLRAFVRSRVALLTGARRS
ncbi:MAG: roadblock/LC7 domain-containing protein [Actinomycetota bacterium]